MGKVISTFGFRMGYYVLGSAMSRTGLDPMWGLHESGPTWDLAMPMPTGSAGSTARHGYRPAGSTKSNTSHLHLDRFPMGHATPTVAAQHPIHTLIMKSTCEPA